MLYTFANEFEVEHVRKMTDIESGYLVVPLQALNRFPWRPGEAIIGGDLLKTPT